MDPEPRVEELEAARVISRTDRSYAETARSIVSGDPRITWRGIKVKMQAIAVNANLSKDRIAELDPVDVERWVWSTRKSVGWIPRLMPDVPVNKIRFSAKEMISVGRSPVDMAVLLHTAEPQMTAEEVHAYVLHVYCRAGRDITVKQVREWILLGDPTTPPAALMETTRISNIELGALRAAYDKLTQLVSLGFNADEYIKEAIKTKVNR